ncbi:cytochrome c oxidase subunit 6B [Photinus pyralis]|nr:cytochrome c oxidase subunit 6B [Photinus pyralis]
MSPNVKKTKEQVEFPWTAPIDARFPNANITGYCFRMFYDYQRCIGLFSVDHEPCEYFKKVYTSLCPHAWVKRWNDQIEDHTFPRDLPADLKKKLNG